MSQYLNKEKKNSIESSYPLALFAVMLLGRMSLGTFQGNNGWGYGEEESESMRFLLAVTIYPAACFSSLRRFSDTTSIIFRIWPFTALIFFAFVSAAWSNFPIIATKYSMHLLGVFFISVASAYACVNNRQKLYSAVHLATMLTLILSAIAVVTMPSKAIVYLAQINEHNLVARWRGVAPSPNVLGFICTVAVWSGIAWRSTVKSIPKRTLLSIMILVATAIVAFGAQSMTSTFACLCIIVISFILTRKKQIGILRFGLRKTIMLSVASSIALFSAAGVIIVGMGRDLTFTGRTELWKFAIEMWAKKPILGWSFDERFTLYATMGSKNEGFLSFHSSYLENLVQGGVVGFILFLLCLILALRSIVRLRKIEPDSAAISFLLFCGMCITGLMESAMLKVFDPQWIMFIVLWTLNEYRLIRAPQDANQAK